VPAASRSHRRLGYKVTIEPVIPEDDETLPDAKAG
jgi:hypothetical protein